MIPFIGPIINLVGNIFGGVNDHFEAKRAIKKMETATKLVIMERQQTADIDWDIQAMKNSGASWKDEYLLILFSPPLVMAFIPGLAPFVGQGFDELAKMPDWYLGAIGIMVAASFGVRAYANKMVSK